VRVRPPGKKLLDFLAPGDPNVATLTLALREMVLEEAPEASESICKGYAVAIAFSFNGRLKDAFCHIAAYTHHVNLGFNQGATMPDPKGVLRGTGKAIRHIRIGDQTDLAAPFLPRYIQAAISLSGGRPKASSL
jgi:hypothetical protein